LITELMSLGRPQKDRIEASGLKPPARSRIFAEQLEIDKEAVTSTYSKYQKDSLKMKIIVDEGYLRLLDQGMMSDGKKVKIHADVEGLGPVFKLRLDFTNQGLKPLTNLALALQFSSANYQLIESIPEVRCLLPSIMLSAVLRVKNVNPLGNNEDIKVFIMQRSQNHPIAGAVINMPVCDPQE
jgi:hypothetical protein